LSSTQRIVRFGFIFLPLSAGAAWPVAHFRGHISKLKCIKAKMDAKAKRMRCKVSAMLMQLFGYCFSEQRMLVSVFRSFCE
jgi:hypothetical protein